MASAEEPARRPKHAGARLSDALTLDAQRVFRARYEGVALPLVAVVSSEALRRPESTGGADDGR